MNKKELEESPYCEVCGHCGEIGCCGIRNFISEHIEGKTNCRNEGLIINELISLCEYKDEVFEKNKKLKDNWNKLKELLEENWKQSQDIWFVKIINKMQELESGDSNE